MSFALLRVRLLERIRHLVSNGEFTERGLARFLSISQPHMHNVLGGVRPLTPELFDSVLSRLRLQVFDLYEADEITSHCGAQVFAQPRTWSTVSVLNSKIGPANPWPEPLRADRRCRVRVAVSRDDMAAIPAPDPAMRVTLADRAVAVLDVSPEAVSDLGGGGLYVVSRGKDTLLRYVRAGAECLYLADDLSVDVPLRWTRASFTEAAVRARVIWLGKREEIAG